MRSMGLRALQSLALAGVLAAAGAAQAATIATFSDPAPHGAVPLFERVGNTLTGGWDDPGLTLIMPITAATYPDATFTMTPLTILNAGGSLSAGQIEFKDSGGNMVFEIVFDSAQLFQPFGFGATVLFGLNDVTFNVPGIAYPLDEEMFAFSFANQATIAGGYSWTAAFTSSAIPEPASLVLLAVGALAALRRR